MTEETPVSKSRRRALFGGSFDPIHLGHLGIVRAVLEQAEMGSVILLPCYVSPFKVATTATAGQRERMIRIGLEEIHCGRASVSTYELDRPGPNYSWQTAEHFARSEPDTDWHWIVGTDQWEQIEKWARPDRLRELLHFLVVTRGSLEVEPREGWRHSVIRFEHPASSTAIRSNRDAHRDWLSPGVYRYCLEEGIYEPPRSHEKD